MQYMISGVILALISLIQAFADNYLAEASQCIDDQG